MSDRMVAPDGEVFYGFEPLPPTPTAAWSEGAKAFARGFGANPAPGPLANMPESWWAEGDERFVAAGVGKSRLRFNGESRRERYPSRY